MLAGKCYVRRKTEVFTNQHGIPNCEAAGKFLVVGVAKSHDKLTLFTVEARLAKSETTEAIHITFRKAVLLLFNSETIVLEGFASLVNEGIMSDREVVPFAFGVFLSHPVRSRSFDSFNGCEVNFVGGID